MHKFIGLKPKMYSILYGKDTKEIKRTKGISTAVVKRYMLHKDYKSSLFNRKRYQHNMRRFGSERHEIYTYNQEKISLNPYDDKRFILSYGIH